MTHSTPVYFVTGANGQLGQIIVRLLLAKGVSVIAGVRDLAKGADLEAMGARVRVADYDDPQGLAAAFAGVDRLMFVSGSEVGKRVRQHGAVVEAAKASGVGFIAYTSILRADESPIGLAPEHKATEELIRASGIAHAFLRNGWYTENLLMAAGPAIEHGALMTCAGEGRFSAATREDFAEGAVAVLTMPDPPRSATYELAGSGSFTMADLAAELSEAAGKPVNFVNLPEDEYAKILASTGMPEFFAQMLAETDTLAAQGWLLDESRTLEKLIGRPTTPLNKALAAMPA